MTLHAVKNKILCTKKGAAKDAMSKLKVCIRTMLVKFRLTSNFAGIKLNFIEDRKSHACTSNR